ncbi:pilus assembly PilX family protein [Solilutibacter pythonis]|uniref:pilus assembly PilX family protein n=1 Tax=Solilutibacter pythonis TaxID=2483112 RepID=UPI001313E420|nr:PilX N-terminal domain-containing pilus assembly protein [Lysobacter pythonis]
MKAASGYYPVERQHGAALIVVLLLLLIVTLLGLASMRGAIMQERMAAATMARSVAFQGAEAGLRQAEILIRDGGKPPTFPSAGCSKGRCAMPAPPNQPAWMANGFWDRGNGFQKGAVVGVGSMAVTPKFVIEDFGTVSGVGGSECIDVSKPCIKTAIQNVYRITSYASTSNGGEVILQSIYRR